MEILDVCLQSAKKPDVSVMAARVAVLASLWGADLGNLKVEDAILKLLQANNHRGDHFTVLLSCLVILLATDAQPQDKPLDILIKTHIIPTIQSEADKVTAKQAGEEVVETNQADDDAPALSDYLIEFLESWQASVGSLDDTALIESHLKDAASAFLQLLHHDIEAIRIAAAHCLLTVADLADRYDFDFAEEISEATKSIARIAHDPDYEWSQEGTSRKAFESIGEIIAEGQFLVALDLVTLSAAPNGHQNVSGHDRAHFEANRNRKGHPITGYTDAAVLEFFNDHLGHNFADLFSIHNPHRRRDNDRAFQAMRHALLRHPGATSQSLHVDSVRQYGYNSHWRSRSFLDDWGRKGHRKVRVADYL